MIFRVRHFLPALLSTLAIHAQEPHRPASAENSTALPRAADSSASPAACDGVGTAVVFTAVPVGTILPICVRRVRSTGTTASLLVALY